MFKEVSSADKVYVGLLIFAKGCGNIGVCTKLGGLFTSPFCL